MRKTVGPVEQHNRKVKAIRRKNRELQTSGENNILETIKNSGKTKDGLMGWACAGKPKLTATYIAGTKSKSKIHFGRLWTG